MARPTANDVHVEAPMSASPQRVSKPWSMANVPPPARNWTPDQKQRCIAAGNSVLKNGGTEQEAIFACIRAAKGGTKVREKQYRINGMTVPLYELAAAYIEKVTREEAQEQAQARARKYGIVVRDDGNLSIPGRFKKLGASEADFADPTNYLYPIWLTVSPDNITDEQLGMVRNASVRFSQFRSRYDDKSAAKVQERIERARKRFKVGEHREEAEKSDVEWEIDVIKADERQLVYGIVLQPDRVDSQGDMAKAEDVEEAAHGFLIKTGRIDLNHQQVLPPQAVAVAESYIAPESFELNGHQVTKGSWVLVTKVFDTKLWQKIKNGEFGAYSIKGRGKRVPVK